MPIEDAPIWFDETYYISQKVIECNAINFGGRSNWQPDEIRAALAVAGQTPWENFFYYGNAENVSPTPLFNVGEYLMFKARQLSTVPGYESTNWTPDRVLAAFREAGLSAWNHYTQYGQFEDLNPSNSFDTGLFWAAKLQQLNSADGGTGFDGHQWTMESMQQFFRAHRLNPLMNLPMNDEVDQLLLSNRVPADEHVNSGSWNPWTSSYEPDQSIALSADRLAYVGSKGNDVFTGVVGGSGATLFPNTTIDGGDGEDTLIVNMRSSFSGFTTTDALENVETVDLVNSSSQTLRFSAINANGVQHWNLESARGGLTLTDIGQLPQSIGASSLAAGSVNVVSFADGAASGGSKAALLLNLENNGSTATTSAPAELAIHSVGNVEMELAGYNSINVNLLEATTVNMHATGSTTRVGLLAPNATTLDINLGADTANGSGLTLTGATSLTAASTISLHSDSRNGLSINADLPEVTKIDISGSGNVGINSSIGLQSTKDITIDASHSSGTINLSSGGNQAITADKMSYNGSAGNDYFHAVLEGTGSTINLNGGSSNITLTGNATGTSVQSITVNAGTGVDSLHFGTTKSSTGTLFTVNNMRPSDTVQISAFGTAEGKIETAWTEGKALKALQAFGVITGTDTGNVSIGESNKAFFVYGGNTYFGNSVPGETVPDGAGLVQLVGVQSMASVTTGTDGTIMTVMV